MYNHCERSSEHKDEQAHHVCALGKARLAFTDYQRRALLWISLVPPLLWPPSGGRFPPASLTDGHGPRGCALMMLLDDPSASAVFLDLAGTLIHIAHSRRATDNLDRIARLTA